MKASSTDHSLWAIFYARVLDKWLCVEGSESDEGRLVVAEV